MKKQVGFGLVEMMFTVGIMGILVAWALPNYFDYIRESRRYDAQRMMMNNAKFMEQFYSRKYSFKQNSTTWPTFPEDEKLYTGSKTGHFCIKMQGNPRGVKGDHYTMKAVAFDKKADAGSLILNEDFQLMICENSSSTCDDSVFFKGDSARTDKNCRFL